MNGLNIEFKALESAGNVDSAQAATETSHKDWLDIQSADVQPVDVSVQKSRSSLFSSARAQKDKLEHKKALKSQETHEAFWRYHRQGESRKCDYQVDLMQIV
jgi:hypothetical protein